jgi:hypothetical protein
MSQVHAPVDLQNSTGPWSIVDRIYVPLWGSNHGHRSLLRWLGTHEARTAVAKGGTAGVLGGGGHRSRPKWRSSGRQGTVWPELGSRRRGAATGDGARR